MDGVRHTRYGWWLEEAGPVEATAPLAGDTTADVVIAGGGYLGLWTAWQLKELEPSLDVVVLEAGLAGHGPSGRNGGFVSTLWDDDWTCVGGTTALIDRLLADPELGPRTRRVEPEQDATPPGHTAI